MFYVDSYLLCEIPDLLVNLAWKENLVLALYRSITFNWDVLSFFVLSALILFISVFYFITQI